MAVKQVSLKDLAKELKATSTAQQEKLKRATLEGCMESIPMLVERSPVDTGLYAQSWKAEALEDGNGARIGNYAPYAAVIEFGARPGHWVPIKPLLEWAKRVLTNTTVTDKKTGKERKVKTGQPESGYSPEVWALAKGTQRAIYQRGIYPKHILENAVPVILDNIKRAYAQPDKS